MSFILRGLEELGIHGSATARTEKIIDGDYNTPLYFVALPLADPMPKNPEEKPPTEFFYPELKITGVSTLKNNSGIIKYKVIIENLSKVPTTFDLTAISTSL